MIKFKPVSNFLELDTFTAIILGNRGYGSKHCFEVVK